MADFFKGLKNFVPQGKAELKRLGAQGSMELANALFNGSAFVPYGPGQNPKNFEREQAGSQEQAVQEQEPQKGNDGMEM